MIIPVGYITKQIFEVEPGDCLHVLGEVYDIFDGEEEEEFKHPVTGEAIWSVPLVVVTPSQVTGQTLESSFWYYDTVRVLVYETLTEAPTASQETLAINTVPIFSLS